MITDGVQLNVELAGAGYPLLLLHGFTGGAATWHPVMSTLREFRTIAPDLIGHGASDAPGDESRYAMACCVSDVVAILDALGVERAAVLGYSMGGRVALQFALAAPERVAALVLESASPGIDDRDERGGRVAADRALADSIERGGVAAFVDAWEDLPLWSTQARLPGRVRASLRVQRLRNSALGLANSLRGMGAGAQEPVLGRLGELAMPVLLIAGGEDKKYRDLAAAMQERIAGARAHIVEGAGHAVHLERPPAFARLVKEFLTSCLPHQQQPVRSDRR
ncbi:MAG TPA: 2-succinyl-6-hydroxy-2,4-cyclohexadiene-1-carboxylate synthase [Dehalococcoidia bacterium]|nr:2-succinyl-6-hydroxy-2,4-cyclohexadiene-1-carboxylate synthase [Dehalococcoidia bacterium]